MQKYIYIFYVHSQPLSIAIIEWVDDSNSQSKNKPAQRSQETKIKPVMLCAHGSYKANFETCFMDLETETQFFQQHCWKTAETITA